MTANDFARFGDPKLFALDLRLMKDPDGDEHAPVASRGSWGQWRLWANGRNLCRHDLLLSGAKQTRLEPCEWVTWYLAPLLRWIAENWGPLLHEQRFPSLILPEGGGTVGTARDAYLKSLSLLAEESQAFVPWQDWGKRHSIRRAAEGGIVPDLFLRRMNDDIEISWGNRPQPGGDDARFPQEKGVAHASVRVVGAKLNEALQWAVKQPAWTKQPWFSDFCKAVEARSAETAQSSWLSWHLDGSSIPGRLTKLFQGAQKRLSGTWEALFDNSPPGLFIPILAPEVAMFGTLSPRISEDAAVKLLQFASKHWRADDKAHPIDKFVHNQPAWRTGAPYDQGYSLAEDFLDEAEIDQSGPMINLNQILEKLSVTVLTESLGAEGPRGVALAATNVAPAIIVNSDYRANRHPKGQRFTLAHEFCHILYDQGSARRVTHASTPWAPVAVERRANAFAAMLLMPRSIVRRTLTVAPEHLTLEGVAEAANRMDVGIRALIHHLGNMREFGPDTQGRLMADLDADSDSKDWGAH